MLLRILLILAIIAGIGAAVIGFVQVKPGIEKVKENLATEQAAHKKTQASLDATKKDLASVKKDLEAEKANVETAKKETEAAKAAQAEAEGKVAPLTEKIAKLEDDVKKAKGDLAAWTALKMTPKQVLELQATVKKDREQIAKLEGTIKESNRLADYWKRRFDDLTKTDKDDPDIGPTMVGPIKGKITAVDPKWEFVMLDIGAKAGLVPNGVLMVSRDGKLIGKVRVRTVNDGTSMANIMPGWKLKDILEGDQVIY